MIFNFDLDGHGIVNYDSGKQKFLWNRESGLGNKSHFTTGNDNNMYAKKTYFRKNDGSLGYRIKISSDALRNAIFRGDAVSTNPSISHHKTMLNSFIGSEIGLIRGYMFANRTETLKRKSPLTITSAIQTNDAESYMEFCSRSGEKLVGDDGGVKDTTIFRKETIGDITYSGRGFINIPELQFLSCDTIFDRPSFNPDDYGLLEHFLSSNIPNFNGKLGFYRLKTSAVDESEYGMLLSNENTVYLVKETLKRLLDLHIVRSGSYANLSSLRVKLNPNDDWVELQSEDDIANLTFDVNCLYEMVDRNEALKRRDIIASEILKNNAKGKAKK